MREGDAGDGLSGQERLFRRREKAARAGQRLPTEEELLRGMQFFRATLREDLREFGERLARHLRRRRRLDLAPLTTALEELAVEQSRDSVAAVEAALAGIPESAGLALGAIRLRCLLYRAGLGDPEAAAAIAGEAAILALKDLKDSNDTTLLWTSLGWAAFSRDLDGWRRSGAYRNPAQTVDQRNELSRYAHRFEEAIRRHLAAAKDQEKDGASPADIPDVETVRPSASSDGTVLVLGEVGNKWAAQGKQVAKEFQQIAGRPLPLPITPDLVKVSAGMRAEFPHADQAIDVILKGLVGREHVRLRPTIIVGPPGSGKSRFARRLAEELGVPHELIPCGGISDSGLGGTPRRWSSGEPSLPMLAVRRHECAGPVIILDEIEKVGTGRHNGNLHDVLLGLFEPETSSRWHDPYIQSNCDLSNLSWLMTANDVALVPAVLRDRCRIVRFPEAALEHLPVLAGRILEQLYSELGHDSRWAVPLGTDELEAVASTWGGGSIRSLRRIVEKIVGVRDLPEQIH